MRHHCILALLLPNKKVVVSKNTFSKRGVGFQLHLPNLHFMKFIYEELCMHFNERNDSLNVTNLLRIAFIARCIPIAVLLLISIVQPFSCQTISSREDHDGKWTERTFL